MSELVWGIKNGDLEQVRDIVENKANMTSSFVDFNHFYKL